MDNSFCQAIVGNDRATLKKIVNKQLQPHDADPDQDKHFASLKKWLETFECVESVEIVPGELRTDPPVKELIVFVRNQQNERVPRTIGITLFPNKLRFNHK